MRCPHCNKSISPKLAARELASRGGKATTAAKIAAARANRPLPKFEVICDDSGATVSRHILQSRAEIMAERLTRRTGTAHRVITISAANR